MVENAWNMPTSPYVTVIPEKKGPSYSSSSSAAFASIPCSFSLSAGALLWMALMLEARSLEHSKVMSARASPTEPCSEPSRLVSLAM